MLKRLFVFQSKSEIIILGNLFNCSVSVSSSAKWVEYLPNRLVGECVNVCNLVQRLARHKRSVHINTGIVMMTIIDHNYSSVRSAVVTDAS